MSVAPSAGRQPSPHPDAAAIFRNRSVSHFEHQARPASWWGLTCRVGAVAARLPRRTVRLARVKSQDVV